MGKEDIPELFADFETLYASSSLIRLGWPNPARLAQPDRPHPPDRTVIARRDCHAGPTRLARARWSAVSSPGGAVSRVCPVLSGPAVTLAGESPSGRTRPAPPL
jgi:hypothetical protein